MARRQADIQLPPALNDSSCYGYYAKTDTLHPAAMPAFIAAQEFEEGMNVVGNDCNPPPDGIGVEVVTGKDSPGQVAFQHGMRFLAMAATFVIPGNEFFSGRIPVGHMGVDFAYAALPAARPTTHSPADKPGSLYNCKVNPIYAFQLAWRPGPELSPCSHDCAPERQAGLDCKYSTHARFFPPRECTQRLGRAAQALPRRLPSKT